MRGSVEHAREGELPDGLGIVARLDHVCEPVGALTLQFVGRERGPQRDVRHDCKSVGKARHRDVESDRRNITAAVGNEIRAEKVHRVGELERRPRPGPFEQHGSRQVGDAELAGRIVAAAAQDDKVGLHDRNLVKLHEPDGQSVRQLAFLNHRKLECRRSARLRRVAAVGCLGRDGERREDGSGNGCERVAHGYFSPSGSTVSSTRAPFGRNFSAAARMSDGDSAR